MTTGPTTNTPAPQPVRVVRFSIDLAVDADAEATVRAFCRARGATDLATGSPEASPLARVVGDALDSILSMGNVERRPLTSLGLRFVQSHCAPIGRPGDPPAEE